MKILVTGGLGFVGNAIVRSLLAEGHEVHALGRTSDPPLNKLIHGLHYHCHDLSGHILKKDWFKGTDTVFHVAAKAGVGGRYEEYKLANLIATEQLLLACSQMEVSHFIYTSSLSVSFLPDRSVEAMNRPLTQKEVFSPYASTKALAEQSVLSAHNPKGMRTLALRPHLVWGHGDPHLLPRVISKHRAGKLKIVGDGKNRVDLTHLDNVVHAHLCALRSMVSDRQLGGKAYFVGQGEPVLLWDWLNEIFSELGLPRLEKSVSYGTAYRLGHLIEGSGIFFWQAL